MKPNIIPSYTELEFYLRAPSMKDLSLLTEKVENCFRSAALATGCEVRTYLWACFCNTEPDPEHITRTGNRGLEDGVELKHISVSLILEAALLLCVPEGFGL